MKKLKHKLPPLTSLVAFETAGRMGSFTEAATELNVTREAVSRQIKSLEVFLGVALFERDANRASMSALGTRFYEIVSPNLWAIANSADEIFGTTDQNEDDEKLAKDTTIEADSGTLLIIDDLQSNIDHITGLLSQNYHILGRTSGKEALEFLANEPVDLILLDIKMPEMDGYEICKNIKSTAHLSDIPIIFLTSSDSPEDETAGLQSGACDFISRPIVPAVLRARIKNHLERTHAQKAIMDILNRRAQRITKAEEILSNFSDEIGAFLKH